MDALISVIVPVYNAEKYIKECLESITGQAYRNLEIILVNDGSTDKSDEICREYAKRDSRVRYITQNNNGVSAARNNGMRVANGEYVVFVDADDLLPPLFCETICATMREWDMVLMDWCGFSQNVDIKTQNTDMYSICTEMRFLNDCSIRDWLRVMFSMECKIPLKDINAAVVWAKIYRRSFLERNGISFPTEIAIGEDMLFNLRCFAEKPRVCYYPVTAYYYRANDTSAVNRYNPGIRKNNEKFLEILCTLCREKCSDSVEEEIQFRKLQQIVYVLSSDIFHPNNPKTRKTKKEEFLEFIESMGYQQIPLSALKVLPIKQRVALLLALSKQYEIIDIYYTIKNKIKSK